MLVSIECHLSYGESSMRNFEIALYDRFGRFISRHLAVCLSRGGAYQQARLMLGGMCASFVVEEI